MIVMLDNGHGSNTSGKCSPDGTHREYKWARDFVDRLHKSLVAAGIDVHILVPEDTDIPLMTRCARANGIALKKGKKNCLLISIHNDAAGSDKKWHTARGFSARTALKPSAASMAFAKLMQSKMKQAGFGGNRSVPNEGFYRQNLAICRETTMPAVLCENLFMDNKQDLAILNSELALERMCEVYVEAIKEYIAKKLYL